MHSGQGGPLYLHLLLSLTCMLKQSPTLQVEDAAADPYDRYADPAKQYNLPQIKITSMDGEQAPEPPSPEAPNPFRSSSRHVLGHPLSPHLAGTGAPTPNDDRAFSVYGPTPSMVQAVASNWPRPFSKFGGPGGMEPVGEGEDDGVLRVMDGVSARSLAVREVSSVPRA